MYLRDSRSGAFAPSVAAVARKVCCRALQIFVASGQYMDLSVSGGFAFGSGKINCRALLIFKVYRTINFDMDATYYLGIDAGGTSTKARLTDASGKVLASAQASAGSLRAGAAQGHAALIDVSAQVMRAANLENVAQKHVICAAGIAGFSLEKELAALRALPFPFQSIELASDGEIACIGAHGGRDGAIVIAGTGSIGIARLSGSVIRIGGYGFPISDEGSGAEIGFQALKAFCQVRDGRRVADALAARLAPMIDAEGLHWWRDQALPKDFARIAPLVFAAQQVGDPTACSIVNRAGEEISKIALALCAQGAARWSLMGGLAQPLHPFLNAMARRLHVAAGGDAIDGALWLARRGATS
jgi:glucosamine kinase